MIQNSSISLKKWTNPTATYCSYWTYALFMEYSTVHSYETSEGFQVQTLHVYCNWKRKNSTFVVENWYQNIKNDVTIRVNNHRHPAAVADIAA